MQTKLSSTTFDPRNPAFDEAWGFIMFIGCLRSEPETCFEQRAGKYLLPDKINYLKRKFPRANYQSTSEWAEAVINEIYFVLYPGIAGDKGEKAWETTEEIDADLRDNFKEASRQWRADCRVTLGIMHASELLEYELKQGELLEARIARKIKSLFELKTMEQMLGQT